MSSKSSNAANTSGSSKTFTFEEFPKNIGRKGRCNTAFRILWDVVTRHVKHLKPSHRTSQRPIRTSTTQAAKVCKSRKFTLCLKKETQRSNMSSIHPKACAPSSATAAAGVQSGSTSYHNAVTWWMQGWLIASSKLGPNVSQNWWLVREGVAPFSCAMITRWLSSVPLSSAICKCL